MKISRILGGFALAAACTVAGLTHAAEVVLPATLKIVVPYSAGGVTDLLARYLADQMRQSLGRTVIVENRPGASGQIGSKFVADGLPNGSVLLLHTAAWPASKVFFKAPLVEVPQGLEPITLLADEVYVMAASVGAPFKSFPELISYAQNQPGKLNYASGGLGDTYLVFENFRKKNQLDMVGVEYKGAAPALAALIANEVQIGFQPLSIARSYEAAGRLRILAVSGNKRQAKFPSVPTFEEAGVKHAGNRWYALYAPPKTAKATIDRLQTEVATILARPETRQKMLEISMEPRPSTPEQLQQLIAESLQEFSQMAQAIGYQPQ